MHVSRLQWVKEDAGGRLGLLPASLSSKRRSHKSPRHVKDTTGNKSGISKFAFRSLWYLDSISRCHRQVKMAMWENHKNKSLVDSLLPGNVTTILKIQFSYMFLWSLRRSFLLKINWDVFFVPVDDKTKLSKKLSKIYDCLAPIHWTCSVLNMILSTWISFTYLIYPTLFSYNLKLQYALEYMQETMKW